MDYVRTTTLPLEVYNVKKQLKMRGSLITVVSVAGHSCSKDPPGLTIVYIQ